MEKCECAALPWRGWLRALFAALTRGGRPARDVAHVEEVCPSPLLETRCCLRRWTGRSGRDDEAAGVSKGLSIAIPERRRRLRAGRVAVNNADVQGAGGGGEQRRGGEAR